MSKNYIAEIQLKSKIKNFLSKTPEKIAPKSTLGKVAATTALTGLIATGYAIKTNRGQNPLNIFSNQRQVEK